MSKQIPKTAVKIQTGLYLYSYDKVINGRVLNFKQLYASDGYCFYNTELDTYDEEGNLQSRTYYTWMSLSITQNLSTFVSVPIEKGMEIA